MAATALVQGVQRELWRELANQGPGAQVVNTGIHISAAKLACVQGLLTIDSAVGAPVITAVPSVGATGFLVVTVTNLTGGTTANWTLDIRLVQSPSQATRGATGYIQVASGVTGGLAGSQNLAETYNVGTLVAHQTMTIDDVGHGGGIIIDASTAAATVANPAVLVRQNAAVSTPVQFSRRGDDAVGPILEFEKARGTYAVPADIQTNDAIGDVNFTGRYSGAFRPTGRIESICTLADESFEAALDFYSDSSGDAAMSRLWRMVGQVTAGENSLIGYGANPVVRPDTTNTGALGRTDRIWADIYAGNEQLYHASADTVSSYLNFYKSRGTLAVPAAVNASDVLGQISIQGYTGAGYTESARIRSRCTSAPGNYGTDLEFFIVPAGGAIGTAFSINNTTGASSVFTFYTAPQLIPNADGTGQLGISSSQWLEGHIRTAHIYTNAIISVSAAAIGGGAAGTLLFSNDSTMPGPQANQVYLGAGDFTGGTNLAVLAIDAEEPAVDVGAAAVDKLIPVMYNGNGYYLHATLIVI